MSEPGNPETTTEKPQEQLETKVEEKPATAEVPNSEEEAPEKAGEEEEENVEDSVAGYLKDYESLLKYTLKLLGDNKFLMQENLKMRLEAEDMVKMNLRLLEENEKIKNERDKLLSDSMTLIEYNDYLQASKDTLERDLLDIKEKFYAILGGMQGLGGDDDEDDSKETGTSEPEKGAE